jgi:hypothetical protein
MGNVEFNESRPTNYNYNPNKGGGIGNFIKKIGLAKDDKGANQVMITITVICLAIAIYFMFN